MLGFSTPKVVNHLFTLIKSVFDFFSVTFCFRKSNINQKTKYNVIFLGKHIDN